MHVTPHTHCKKKAPLIGANITHQPCVCGCAAWFEYVREQQAPSIHLFYFRGLDCERR